jgi:hypothetical protein
MYELKMIASDYNKTVDNSLSKIKLHNTKAKLYNEIRSTLAKECKEESCWIEQDFIKSDHKRKLQTSFRPVKPHEWYKNKRTWLNTFDILHVMKQYEKLYKDFSFLGVYPIDFRNKNSSGYCIGDSLCEFNIQQFLSKNKKQFAIVLNLDKHTQPGSHWVALYCNLNPKKNNFGIYYYDSVASRPGKEVKEFVNNITSQVLQYFPKEQANKFVAKFNITQKQYKNSECGVFSMVFITQALKNIDFDTICKYMKKDDHMNDIRDVLYRPNYKIIGKI